MASSNPGHWKVSELESVRIQFLPISEEIGKCQNRKVSELESVRIGKCQNWKVSESESVRMGKCGFYSQLFYLYYESFVKICQIRYKNIWKSRIQAVQPYFFMLITITC